MFFFIPTQINQRLELSGLSSQIHSFESTFTTTTIIYRGMPFGAWSFEDYKPRVRLKIPLQRDHSSIKSFTMIDT